MMKNSRKLLSLLMVFLLMFSTLGSVLAEDGLVSSESAPSEIVDEVTAEPEEEPTTAPTEEPTTVPTETSASPTEAPVDAPTESPESASSAEPSVEPSAEPSVEPSAQPADEPTSEPVSFAEGLVKLTVGTELFADEALQTSLGTLAEDGIAYGVQGETAVKLTLTTDGVATSEAFVASDAIVALTSEEIAAYTASPSDLLFAELPLFPLVLLSQDSLLLPAGGGEDSLLRSRLSSGTELFSDAALTQSLGVLESDGVVVQTANGLAYTTDELSVALAYAKDAPVELSAEEEAAYDAREGGLLYEGVRLFALSLRKPNYTLDTYGFPGMPEDYQFAKEKSSEKKALSPRVQDVRGMQADTEYQEGKILVPVVSREEAELAAASFNGTLSVYFDWGLAVIELGGGATTVQALEAAMDSQTRLLPAYPNMLYDAEPAHPDAPVGKPTKTSLSTFSSAPSAGTWMTAKTNDPFVSDPSDTTHLSKRYTNITSGYQYVLDIVGAWSAWGLTKGDHEVKVAIIDTGVLTAHEDIPNDVIDLLTEAGAASGKISSSIDNLLGTHGTHVAGIIAGIPSNGTGGVGVAPGVQLMAYRCENSDGDMTTDLLADGLHTAADRDAHVVNMSLGGPDYDEIFNQAVQYCVNSGTAVFSTSGNEGKMVYKYPANYDNVISVASTDNNNARSFYSTYGTATLSAPGSNVLSTVFPESKTPYSGASNAYQSFDGTSMACPVATACAALYYSARGATHDLNGDGAEDAEDVAYLKKVLTSNTTKLTSSAFGMGAGVINIAKVFSTMVTKPTFSLSAGSSAQVPSTASLNITTGWNGKYIVYTVDDKNPSVKDGQVVLGTEVQGSLNRSDGRYVYALPLNTLSAGKHTVRALNVNAQGKVSAVASYSFTVDNLTVDSIAVNSDNTHYLAAGKSIKLKATVSPASMTMQKRITWAITSGSGATITTAKDGTATLKGVSSGTVSVTASCNGHTSEAYSITIVPVAARSITLVSKAATVYMDQTIGISVDSITGTDKQPLTPGQYTLLFTSSKPAVATVDASGMITPVSPGKATITCAILDGSGKKASMSVTVQQRVSLIRLISPHSPASDLSYHIASGKKLTFKMAVEPANASNKKLIWSMDADGEALGAKVRNGTVSVPAGRTGNFTVRCESADGFSNRMLLFITVNDSPLSALTLDSADPKVTRNSKGILTGATLFTVNKQSSVYDGDETQLQLTTNAGTDVPLEWTSSNESVATVENGLIVAHAKGSATITCTAMDGSGKKASLKVNVIIPASSVSVYTTNTDKLHADYPSIAFGKSRKFAATLGTTYGIPTSKKVTWSYEVRHYNDDYYPDYLYDMDNTTYYSPLTSAAVTNCIKLSSSGTLSVSSRIADYWEGSVFIKIIATATDGSGEVGCTYAETAAASFVKAVNGNTPLARTNGNSLIFVGHVRDLSWYSGNTIQLNSEGSKTNYIYILFAGSSWNDDFGATSSKPQVASVIDDIKRLAYSEYSSYYVLVGKTWYPLYTTPVKGDNPGKATIKLFTNDGSNKTASFNITVTNPE